MTCTPKLRFAFRAVCLFMAIGSNSTFACAALQQAETRTEPTSQQDDFGKAIRLINNYCNDCHSDTDPEADFSIHNLNADLSQNGDLERWEKILEMVSIGDMPPADSPQFTKDEKAWLTECLNRELEKVGISRTADLAFPKFGNRVDHDSLFSGEHIGPAYTQSRLWRISPQIYQRFAANVDMARKLNAPLQVTGEEGFRDYALLFADEATIMTMLQNCKRAATTLLHGRVSSKRNRSSEVETKQGGRSGSRHKAFDQFIKSIEKPTRQELETVLNFSIRLLLQREATEQDHLRYLDGFLVENVELAGREAGLTGMLTAIMMSPEFLFRMELGLGEKLPDGRRMLGPREIAYALSYCLFDYVDPKTLTAADEGRLQTREDVAREFRRMLTEPDRAVRGSVGKHFWVTGKGAGITDSHLIEASRPRMLRFFREFFGYTKVLEVFKDDSRHDGKHKATSLVRDADWFVLRALYDDRQVLNQLLTSNRFFVQAQSNRKPIRAAMPYNIDEPMDRPTSAEPFSQVAIELPKDQRAGMLTHPAWLAAHSGNFENDPVRRGKWIREHLLADVVPDLPIGVDAMLPEEHHRTLRQRFEVVNEASCWRCHKKMNPLGDPFEAFDDFGRFRENHLVGEDGNVIASEFEAYSRVRSVRWRDSHKKGAPKEAFKTIKVDMRGELIGTRDIELDGTVSGPIDLVSRLAKSDRVRQSFVRHVFRYWMGRNETLDDSPTLMAMDQAYLESDGSFKELLVALVTSDSFLYRK